MRGNPTGLDLTKSRVGRPQDDLRTTTSTDSRLTGLHTSGGLGMRPVEMCVYVCVCVCVCVGGDVVACGR